MISLRTMALLPTQLNVFTRTSRGWQKYIHLGVRLGRWRRTQVPQNYRSNFTFPGTALGCWRQVCIVGDWHSQLGHGHMNRYGPQGTGLKWSTTRPTLLCRLRRSLAR